MKQYRVRFHEGIPDVDDLQRWYGPTRGGVLVLDNIMEEAGHDKRVHDRFTKESHYGGITVLYLCQDLFPPGRFAKTISRNAHYIIAFNNPRDQTGLRTLLLQTFPDRWESILDFSTTANKALTGT